MAKKLSNITLFVAGDPENAFPTKVFMTYDVKSGKASKKNCVFEIDDPDPEMKVSEIWNSSIAEIKQLEKVEG